MNNNMISQDTNNMGSFLDKLKKEDSNLHTLFKILKITYIVLLIIYIPIFYFMLEDGGIVSIMKVGSIILGFSTFLFVFAYAQKKMKKLSYSEPTLVLLKKTVKRYRPVSPLDLAAFPAIIFLAIGVGLTEKSYTACKDFFASDASIGSYLLDAWHFLTGGDNLFELFGKTINEFPMLIVFMVLFFSVFIIILSVTVGFVIWLARYKPIRDNALALIKEIES